MKINGKQYKVNFAKIVGNIFGCTFLALGHIIGNAWVNGLAFESSDVCVALLCVPMALFCFLENSKLKHEKNEKHKLYNEKL